MNINQRQYLKHKKSILIRLWKKRGILTENWDDLYKLYDETTHCQKCNVLLGRPGDKSGHHKCLDHDHNTHKFRMILCNKCNCSMDLQLSKNNTSGYPQIFWRKSRSRWVIVIKKNQKPIVDKYFKSKYEAII